MIFPLHKTVFLTIDNPTVSLPSKPLKLKLCSLENDR